MLVAQKLNLLHLLLLLSAMACVYYVTMESRQRTLALKRHFRGPASAIVAALVLLFFQVGLKQPIWPFLGALALGLAAGGVSGVTLKLRVDRSWQIPRPAGMHHMIWLALALAAAAAVDITGAWIGPEAKLWRFGATLVAMASAGMICGRAIAVGIRVWRLIG
ncbi:MAG: hypothetical protein PSV46_22300 [Reyranella sp.]|nr:hypothetical protein [Reyranella sp.]